MKIIGNTVGTTMPRTNYNQADPKKADYLVGRENIATKAEVTAEAERITNLEGRTTNLEGVTTNLTKAITHEPYATDEGVAYSKDVPESPMPSATLSAEVSMLGGMTYKDGDTLKSAKVTEVESVGVNLFNKDTVVIGKGLGSGGAVYTDANICYSDAIAVKEGETYSTANVRWCNFYADSNYPLSTNFVSQNSATTLTVPSGAKYVRVSVALASIDVAMLNKGSTALPYTPYVRNTLPIPEAVQALDGYGDGVNETYYNYIDFDKKQFVRNVVKVVYNGTENWSAGTNSPAVEMAFSCALAKKPFQGTSTIHPVGVGISNVYEFNPVASDVADTFRMSTWDKIVWFYPSNFNSLEGWKAYLAKLHSDGNPLTIVYLLATPEVTDISDILTTNKVEVEGNGTLTYKNEHKIAMPSEVAYYMQVKGVALSDADKREIAQMVAEMLGSATS